MTRPDNGRVGLISPSRIRTHKVASGAVAGMGISLLGYLRPLLAILGRAAIPPTADLSRFQPSHSLKVYEMYCSVVSLHLRSMKVYDEYCALARGLEIVGDRWTLLIIRELLLGDRRFTDLVEGLPGVPRNLLSARLDELQEIGLVEQVEFPPPTPVTLYRLTPDGARLEQAVLALTRWGTFYLGTPGDQNRRGAWLGLLISAWREGDRPPLSGELEVRLEGEIFHLRSDRTAIRAGYGPASKPEAILTTDWRPLYRFLTADSDVEAFLQDETTEVQGDPEFLTRTLEWLQSAPGSSEGVDLADAWTGPAHTDPSGGGRYGEVIDA